MKKIILLVATVALFGAGLTALANKPNCGDTSAFTCKEGQRLVCMPGGAGGLNPHFICVGGGEKPNDPISIGTICGPNMCQPGQICCPDGVTCGTDTTCTVNVNPI